MNKTTETLRYWLKGVRIYIALAIGLISLEAWGWARLVYGDSATATIRLQEVYAWLALGCLLTAVLIGPLLHLAPKLSKGVLFEARRMVGIGAAWFASLHVAIVYIGQFHLINPFNLPPAFERSFAVGISALVILLALAFTSFNAAFRRMGIWWFRLHRLVYAAVLLALLHAFMVGVHALSWPFILTLTIVVTLGLGAHLYLGMVRNKQPSRLQIITLCYGIVLTLAVFTYGYTQKLGYNPIEGRNHGHQRR